LAGLLVPWEGEILMPGERGRRTLEQRAREGIPIPRVVHDELDALARRMGVAMLPAPH
jgi:LDH2 family malate/lactate/ureidoglycolate dehydrogenase